MLEIHGGLKINVLFIFFFFYEHAYEKSSILYGKAGGTVIAIDAYIKSGVLMEY